MTASNFSDVPSNHWATSYINKISEGGPIKGYGNGKYGPEDKLTIGQLANVNFYRGCTVFHYAQHRR